MTPSSRPARSCTPHAVASTALGFFSNDPPTTEIYTLSLHDALPISSTSCSRTRCRCSATLRSKPRRRRSLAKSPRCPECLRSEEHTSELQSQFHLVCRLLLEKKKKANALAPRQESHDRPFLAARLPP